jgi:DNA-binding transcriptional MerR regulator
MKLYQIAELEQLTGIKAHTLRIWEKRYGLIEPTRTSTNIRRYDDDQVKKLLNVATLLGSGYKISKIAELKEKEVSAIINSLQQGDSINSISEGFINQLLSAMIGFNEQAFEKAYSSAVNKLGLFDAMLNVFYPLFHKIGVMWVTDNLTPVQEHFASCIIKRKLMAAIDALPLPTKKKTFLLLLPPGEYHDVSLLLANYLVKSKGYHTIYLGQNVPYENIDSVLIETKAQFLLTFYVNPRDAKEVYEEITEHVFLPKDVKFLVSGNRQIMAYLDGKKNCKVLHSPQDLLKILDA